MNLLFIDSSLISLQEFVNGCNDNTKYIIYNINDTFSSLIEKINDLGILSFQYVGFVFEDKGVDGTFEPFVENANFISIDENNEISENKTSQFIKTIINLYNVKYLDFLACNLLNYQYWKLFFEYLQNQTYNESLVVRASNNLSGNLKNGGDWILETTNENIKEVYFNENINDWNYLLGRMIYINAILTNEETDNVYTSGLIPNPEYQSLRKYNNYVNTDYTFEKNIISCASNLDLIAFLTDEPSNNLYVHGKSSTGSLGLGSDVSTTSEITNVTTNIENKKIVAVHLSLKAELNPPLYILSDEPVNNLYVSGTGLGVVNDRTDTFQRVTSLNQKILMISANEEKVMLITDEPNNNVYYLDSTTNNLFVNLNDATLINKKAIFIKCNYRYSAILTDEPINNLYTLGSGYPGALGLGATNYVDVYTNVSDDSHYTNHIKNKHIVDVYIDEVYSTTYALTDESINNLYSTGSGTLGTGNGFGFNLNYFRNYTRELLNKKVVYLRQDKAATFLLTNEPSNNLYAIGNRNSSPSIIGIPPLPNSNSPDIIHFTNISNNDSILLNHLINKQVKLVASGEHWSLVITNEKPTLNSNLYIAGNLNNNMTKTLTKSFMRFKQIEPRTYKKFIKTCITSMGIYLISNEINNNLYFCGSNSFFGTFTTLTNISLMQPNLLGKKIVNMAASPNDRKVYVITSESINNLYGCISDAKYPTLLGGAPAENTFINVNTNIENKKVIKIACDNFINALLTDEQSDNYYVCGNSIYHGAYGNGSYYSLSYEFFTNIVSREISGKKFIDVELNAESDRYSRTYLISDETTNNLYFSGYFEAFDSNLEEGERYRTRFQNVSDRHPNILNKRVVKVSCSYYHSAIITDEISSNLYMCGGVHLGNGFNGNRNIKYSTPNFDIIQNKRIIDVMCNLRSTIVVTNDISNNIYLFGQNTYGELGINNTSDTGVPTPPYDLNRTSYINNTLSNPNSYRILDKTNLDNSNNTINVKYRPRNINIGANNITYLPDFTKNEIVISSLPISNATDNYKSSIPLSSNNNVSGYIKLKVSGYIKLEPAGTRFENHISMDFDVEPSNDPSVYFKSNNDLVPQLIPSTNTSDDDVYYTYDYSVGTITLYTKHFSEAIVIQNEESTPIDFNLDYLNAIISMNVKGDIFKTGIPSLIRDAIAEYYVNVNDMKNIFAFQSDSDDIESINNTDIKYFVRTSQWPSELILNPCNAWVNSLQQIATSDRQGVISDDRELVKHDFIRYIAKSLFNTHLASDLFINENELKYDLSYKGHVVWENILNSLTEIGDVSLNTTLYNGSYGVDISYGYYLTNDASANTNISRELLGQVINSAPSRFKNLNNYSIDATKGLFSIPFIAGDSISFKLTLQPASNQHLIVNRETPIPSRTYQIRINIRESVSKSNIHGNGVNVIVNDTIPSLYNNIPVTDSLNNSFPSKYQDLLVHIYGGYYDGNKTFFSTAPILYTNSTNDLKSISTITVNSFDSFDSLQQQSIKVSGNFIAKKTGTYRFFTYSNNKNILEIDGDEIIVNNDLNLNQINFADKNLIAGNSYSFNLYGGNIVLKYPPIGMTNNNTTITGEAYGNGDYSANASSTSADKHARYAFDNTSAYWRSGDAYPNPTRTTTTIQGEVKGEWVQITLPVQIVLDKFIFIPNSTGTPRPKQVSLLGSNSGSGPWDEIYTTGSNTIPYSNYITVNSNEAYSVYRFVVRTGTSQPFVEVRELRFYEKPKLSAGYLEPLDDGTNTGSTDPNDFIYKL